MIKSCSCVAGLQLDGLMLCFGYFADNFEKSVIVSPNVNDSSLRRPLGTS